MEDDEDEEEEDEYAVEKILSHNFIKGKTIYEIKWVGYEKVEDRTWEPIENLYAMPNDRSSLFGMLILL